MKYHNKNILCLEYDEYVECFGIETYKSDKKRNRITIIGRGGNGREVLIEYETLPADRKAGILQKFGKPYEYIAKQPLVDYVKINWDYVASDWYNKYVLPNSTLGLPEEYVDKYTKAATWLNAINHFTTDKRALKQSLNISIAAFWELAGDLIRANDVALPINERRLKDKLKDYKQEGYPCMIEAWRFGNNNSKKVKDGVAEAVLVKMIANDKKHDDTIIAQYYNKWALKNNYAAITPQTVGYWRKKKAIVTTLSRDGAAINYNQFSKRSQRERPSSPLMLINSDDNVIDLYFRETLKNGKSTNDYYRPTLYVVADAFNDYILGYAVGETNTIELIKAAYRNAINHVKEMTGGNYLWHQIQTDNWAIDPKKEGELATFFKDQAHFTPATIKVAQAKYIERSFGVVWHQQLKLFPNYSGFNITAKEKRNPDAVQMARKDFPTKEQAPQYIAQFIENMRQTVNPATGLTRQNEWLKAFNESNFAKKRAISTEKRLQLFGIKHPHANRITAAGIQVEINRKRLTYDISNDLYIENVNKKIEITYDPYDMSQVLVSDGKGLRFVAGEVQKMPSALADFKEGDMHRFNVLKDFKKQINQHVADSMNAYDEILQRANIDANSLLQAGVTIKEVSHKAQKVLTGHVPESTGGFDWRQAL